MKKNNQIKLLKSLLDIASPSGHEEEIAKFIKTELSKTISKSNIVIDHQNNVIVTIAGKSKKTVMVDAHLDTIGFCVTNVTDYGLITIGQVGYGDHELMTARPLEILTNNGKVNAVIDRTHSHLVLNEADERIEDISEAQIDIGIRKRREVLRHIDIGDFVAYKPYFEALVGNNYAGYGFDDKAGCYVLIETIKKVIKILKGKQPALNMVFVFSAQEETDSKLRAVIDNIKPEMLMSIDVTFATDYGYGENLDVRAGRCDLGKGIVIYRGLDINVPCTKLIEKVADKENICFQTQANTTPGGYTSFMMSNKGIKATAIGIPLRNMHTPVEIINLNDLNSGVKLLTSYLLNTQLKTIIGK